MYLKNVNIEFNNSMNEFEHLEENEQIGFIKYVLERFDNDQINSLDEENPNLLDDTINISIFNPISIGYDNNLISEITKYLNYRLYQKSTNDLLSKYEKLSFEDKINVVTEIILFLESKDLLPDYLDGYSVARAILNYKK